MNKYTYIYNKANDKVMIYITIFHKRHLVGIAYATHLKDRIAKLEFEFDKEYKNEIDDGLLLKTRLLFEIEMHSLFYAFKKLVYFDKDESVIDFLKKNGYKESIMESLCEGKYIV